MSSQQEQENSRSPKARRTDEGYQQQHRTQEQAAVALQAYATRSGFGGPCALLLLIIAPFVFGRDAWDGETSAYSVFNGGRRIAGTFTAEQFDAQLRGGRR